jgi:hypothetical protein
MTGMGFGFPSTKPHSAKIFLFATAIAFGAFPAGNRAEAGTPVKKNPQVEYIAPDGQFSSLSATHSIPQKSSAEFVDSDTISCVLREGETTFIIKLPTSSVGDRFTFLNENAAASGELRIAVSNSPLPADSPKWTEVDGIIPFAHKRLFKLSMLGVETKFVRLSFKVERQHQASARISHPFRTSLLTTTIDSGLSRLHEQGLDLSVAMTSVAALPAKQN